MDIASFIVKLSYKSIGTKTIPPPIPKNPEMKPVITPSNDNKTISKIFI
jgi:hypothetical protein